MPRPLLLDNTVLSNLAVVERVDLVFRVWPDRAMTTRQVLREYELAEDAGLLPQQAWVNLPLVEMTPDEIAFSETLSPRLGAGERSCLAVAHARGGLFVSDDADARAMARRLGIHVSGTLGVLILATRRGYLTLREANALLAEMIALGYHSPVSELDTFI
ncbi:MAG: DUF3368 domain-containing protein [Anaerolineae bacterium]